MDRWECVRACLCVCVFQTDTSSPFCFWLCVLGKKKFLVCFSSIHPTSPLYCIIGISNLIRPKLNIFLHSPPTTTWSLFFPQLSSSQQIGTLSFLLLKPYICGHLLFLSFSHIWLQIIRESFVSSFKIHLQPDYFSPPPP